MNLLILLNRVYKNALIIELIGEGFQAEKEYPIKVFYKGKLIGEYFADIVVNRKIILELKAEERLNLIHQAQIINTDISRDFKDKSWFIDKFWQK